MDARSIGPSGGLSDSRTTSTLSDSSVAAIALSVLGMIGILCVVTLLTVKLSIRFPRKPTEKQPLLEDRYTNPLEKSADQNFFLHTELMNQERHCQQSCGKSRMIQSYFS